MDLAGYAAIRTECGRGKRGSRYEKVETGLVRFVFQSPVRNCYGVRPGTADLSMLTPEQIELLRARFASDAVTIDFSHLTPEQIDSLVDKTFNIKGDE